MGESMALEILLLIVGLIIGIVLTYLFLHEKVKNQIQKQQIEFEKWKQETIDEVRKATAKSMSQAIKGRLGERFAPLLPMFEYEIADARFIGDPIDFVVFDGHSKEDIQKIIFVEVKTGKTKNLTKKERQIRDRIKDKKVEWNLCHIDTGEIEKELDIEELAKDFISEATNSDKTS